MSKKNKSVRTKNEPEKFLSDSSTSTFNCPAISVIIPLYNVEKYIGECLDSLLAQTFQDFEVIVVDDCSTDNSPAIVRSYTEKFGEQLTLTKMKKNYGGGGYIPRNRGIELSRGKYIFFLDADDLITSTALQELYETAEFYEADVVHCESFYAVPENFIDNTEFRRNLRHINFMTGENLMKEPLVWENDFEERIKFFAQRKLVWNIWVQLIRRSFIIENELKMPGAVAQDMTFTICELCSAEKYVIVPKIVNYYRQRPNSISNERIDAAQLIHKWLNSVKCGIEFIDKFLNDREFFLHRPDLKYILLNTFAQEILKHLNEIYAKVPAHALDELLRKEFGADSAFESFIFNSLNVQRLQSMQRQYQFNQFAAQARQRIAELENELRRRSQ